MITIEKRNGYWELYIDGGLLTYNESLQVVTNYLDRHIEDIEEEMTDE